MNEESKERLDLDYIGEFSEGYAPVMKNGKWNFINQEGKFISVVWFDSVEPFKNGFAKVQDFSGEFYIDGRGSKVNEGRQR